jgi:predicted nucleic acid-binding protein
MLAGLLIDTNVVSELGKRRPNSAVKSFMQDKPLDELFVSCVSMAELRAGVEQSGDPVTTANIGTWLAQVIRPMFEGRVLDVTEETMMRWLALVHDGRRNNHTYSQPDLLIAAQALEHDLTVVTRNTRDFERAGVSIVNPWLD